MQDRGGGALLRRENFVEHRKVNHLCIENHGQRRYTLRQQRISLEQDVSKLHKKLKEEISIRKALERAFRRAIGALPRLPFYLPPRIRQLLAEVAVLEEEIIKLEERVVSLRQELYNEALYVSSSQKPKDRNSGADSIPLNKETCVRSCIEKERSSYEINNEQRSKVVKGMLSPFREDSCSPLQLSNCSNNRIFLQNSMSETSQTSNQDSSSATSVAFISRENPEDAKYCISNANEESCSRFSGVESRKTEFKERQKHASSKCKPICSELSTGKSNMELPCSVNGINKKPCNQRLQQSVIMRVAPGFTTSSTTIRLTSKDGNSTEPNRLSEEMLRCLLSIYIRLTKPDLLTDSDSSSGISLSTCSSFHSSALNNSVSFKTSIDVSEGVSFPDPYGIFTGCTPRDIGPYRCYHNITADSFVYNRVASSNGLLKGLRELIDRLSVVDFKGLTHQQKLAFWINVYNICMMHAFLEHGIPHSPQKVAALMQKAVLNVGGYHLNALAIEHFILRLPSNPHNDYLRCGKGGALKHGHYRLECPEPLVSFALSCGSHSSPAVRVYTASDVENELEVAMKEYLQAAVGVTAMNKVVVPKLLHWYMRDFAKDTESLMDWVCEQLPSFLCASMHECLERINASKPLPQIVEVIPYNFSFRYLVPSYGDVVL